MLFEFYLIKNQQTQSHWAMSVTAVPSRRGLDWVGKDLLYVYYLEIITMRITVRILVKAKIKCGEKINFCSRKATNVLSKYSYVQQFMQYDPNYVTGYPWKARPNA